MHKTVLFLIAVGVLTSAGCAGTTDRVVPIGHDTYMVANHVVVGSSSGASQKAKAYESANTYCNSKGKEVETVNERDTDSGWAQIASADLEFRCVASGKP